MAAGGADGVAGQHGDLVEVLGVGQGAELESLVGGELAQDRVAAMVEGLAVGVEQVLELGQVLGRGADGASHF